jgi:hypothetical protein
MFAADACDVRCGREEPLDTAAPSDNSFLNLTSLNITDQITDKNTARPFESDHYHLQQRRNFERL